MTHDLSEFREQAHIINTNDLSEIKIEMSDVLDFIAEYVRDAAIERLEQAGKNELLRSLILIKN